MAEGFLTGEDTPLRGIYPGVCEVPGRQEKEVEADRVPELKEALTEEFLRNSMQMECTKTSPFFGTGSKKDVE